VNKGTPMTNPNSQRRMPLPQIVTGCLVAIATALALGYPTPATAEPKDPGTWDLEEYEKCMKAFAWQQMDMSINEQKKLNEACCYQSGGVFQDDGYIGKCVAPPAPNPGSRQLPGNVRIPPNIGTEDLTPAAPPPVSAAG
jgi:hypothetical protein